jgi:RNA polymerase sigma-70 factor (ECF subfamily)
MDYQETALIEGLKHGDNMAYRELYDIHYVLLCKIAFSFLKDDYLAQTIVDEIFIHIYEKRETLLITTSLRLYLVRSVRNRCLDYLRLKREKTEISFSQMTTTDDWLSSIASSNDYPLGALLENELELEIQQAIERLSVECRTVFEKSRFEDKNYETIAKEMSISVNTVKYHIKNALSKLREDLGKYLR